MKMVKKNIRIAVILGCAFQHVVHAIDVCTGEGLKLP